MSVQNWLTTSESSHLRRLIPALALSILISSCTEPDAVSISLDRVNEVISAGSADTEVRYRLSYDEDYPCSATLYEDWQENDVDWQHRYRFDVQDIKSGSFLEVRDGRRAIIYDGHKESPDGRSVFTEKKISNVRYRSPLYDEDQVDVLVAMDVAIRECSERYELE